MPRIIYETHVDSKIVDHDDLSAAKAAVEAHGDGYVVTFVRGADGRDRSSAMVTFENGTWRDVDIHGAAHMTENSG